MNESVSRRKGGRGRPPSLEEEWTKVTVVLYNRQIAFLDHLSAEIRMKSGAAVKRSEIIRALIEFLKVRGINPSEISSEKDLKSVLAENF